MAQQGHDPRGRAGTQSGQAHGQAALIVGMQTVHILARADGLQAGLSLEADGQGQLEQNAVHLVVHVEL